MKRATSTTTRFIFKGDEAKARQLMGHARKLLSSVESRKKRFGGGFGHRTLTLPGGRTINITSLRGMAIAEIYVPIEGEGFWCTPEEILLDTSLLNYSWVEDIVEWWTYPGNHGQTYYVIGAKIFEDEVEVGRVGTMVGKFRQWTDTPEIFDADEYGECEELIGTFSSTLSLEQVKQIVYDVLVEHVASGELGFQ